MSEGAAQIALDAVGFDVRKVELERRALRSRSTTNTTATDSSSAAWARSIAGEVRVALLARRRNAVSTFSSPTRRSRERPRQVWSQCQDEDARHWFPCLDKPHVKMTTELRVARAGRLGRALERRAASAEPKGRSARCGLPLSARPAASRLPRDTGGGRVRRRRGSPGSSGARPQDPDSLLRAAFPARRRQAQLRRHAAHDRALFQAHRRRFPLGAATRRSS